MSVQTRSAVSAILVIGMLSFLLCTPAKAAVVVFEQSQFGTSANNVFLQNLDPKAVKVTVRITTRAGSKTDEYVREFLLAAVEKKLIGSTRTDGIPNAYHSYVVLKVE